MVLGTKSFNYFFLYILKTYLLFPKTNKLFINYDLYSCSLLCACVQLIDKLYEGVLLTLRTSVVMRNFYTTIRFPVGSTK